MKIIIKNGFIIDPKSGINQKSHLLVEDGIIKAITENPEIIIQNPDAQIIDAEGKYVMPGFVDAHCHLRDPGYEYKEDIASGTRSAAAGGFTSVACMPNTDPIVDNKAVISYIIGKARQEGVVNVYPIGAVSKGQKGEELAEMGEMKLAGAVAVSDDGKPVKSSSLMKKALQYAQMFNLPVISHCEDPDLADEGLMNESYNSTVMGLKGIPSAAEEVMVARDIILAEYTGTPVHIAHVSTALSVELIRNAKKRGVRVTCETCPHYFTLTDDACCGFNTLAKVNPPLRSQKDVEAIIQGLRDGTVDIIATDHAPHHKDEKNVEFAVASNGLIGFETAFPLALTYLVKTGYLTLAELVQKMSLRPSEILGLNKGLIEIGSEADITIVDINEKYKVDINSFKSRSKNSPYNGYELFGSIYYTIVNGEAVIKEKELVK